MFYGIDNFDINGVINADRTVQPETWQMKRSHAPIRVEEVDLEHGIVRFMNYHSFTNLNEFDCLWKVESVSEVFQKGNLNLDVPPKTNKIVTLPFSIENIDNSEELFLTISFTQKENSELVEKGHEIYFEQILLPVQHQENEIITLENYKNLTLNEDNTIIKINGDNFYYEFDKDFGLSVISFNGKQIIKEGIDLDVWRAPIDNELSDWELAEAKIWREWKFDSLLKNVESVLVSKISDKEISIEIKVTYLGAESRREVTGFESVFDYRVLASGELVVNHKITPLGDFGWFAKAGLKLKLLDEFDNFEWYGRGPFETYPDRKTGAKIGIYKGKVIEQYSNYLKPQDTGNKTDVRCASLTNNDGIGLAFVFDEPMNIGAIPFDSNELERALYNFQLPKSDGVSLTIDYKVSGVGGTPIAPRVMYRTNPVNYQYTIRIKPFDNNEISLESLISQRLR